jgi:hypothetical protein
MPLAQHEERVMDTSGVAQPLALVPRELVEWFCRLTAPNVPARCLKSCGTGEAAAHRPPILTVDAVGYSRSNLARTCSSNLSPAFTNDLSSSKGVCE